MHPSHNWDVELTITAREITALQHEVGDDTVELGTLISKAVRAGGELTEVLSGLRNNVVVKFEDDATSVAVINADIELYAREYGQYTCRRH